MITTLYKYNTNDEVLVWTIVSNVDKIVITYGQLNGKQQTKMETVETNQSGRGLDAQVALRVQTRIGRQIDKGYCSTIAEARLSKGLNAIKLIRPMLAKRLVDVKSVCYKDAHIQYKYNGYRCLITNYDGKLIAYSRNGKAITSIDHILEGISIPENTTIDGELYVHNTSLQLIGSWIRRKQEESKQLRYIAYDMALSGVPYIERLNKLADCSLGEKSEIATTMPYDGDNLSDMLDSAIELGYEGLMLRQNLYGYDAGNRSASLLKIKKLLDQEFLVLDVASSKDDWGILECLVIGSDKTFRVPAPGTMENKKHILENKAHYVGRLVTIHFFEWTDDGLPFHIQQVEFKHPMS